MITITDFHLRYGPNRILTDINLTLQRGRTTALLGESGAGKPSLALSMMGMSKGKLTGSINLDGFEVRRNLETISSQPCFHCLPAAR